MTLMDKIKRNKTYSLGVAVGLLWVIGGITTRQITFILPGLFALLYCGYKVLSTET